MGTPPPTHFWEARDWVYPTVTVDSLTGAATDYYKGKGYQCLNVSKEHKGVRNMSAKNGNNRTCYGNLVWAMETGLKQTYAAKCYPGLTKDSTMYQFQWALFANAKLNECAGWGCPLPCGMAKVAVGKGLDLVQTYTATAKPTAAPNPSPAPRPRAEHHNHQPRAEFPMFGTAALIVVAIGLLGALGFYIVTRLKGKGPQKKKRAVTKPAEQTSAETVPLVAPAAPQIRTVTMAPVPVTTTAVPITTSAPFATYTMSQPATVIPVTTVQAAPISYVAAPGSLTYAAPAVVAPQRQQTAMELFDELDVNKDGRVDRDEFQRIAALRGIPM